MTELCLYGEQQTSNFLDEFLDRLVAAYGGGEGGDRWALVGIHRRGDLLAERLHKRLEQSTGTPFDIGVLDITLYRDDFSPDLPLPMVRPSRIPFSVEGRKVLLIDDVFFTGRTIRAALNQLADFGRARRVELAVFIDRDMRELPIRPDHVGIEVAQAREQMVQLRLSEIDGCDEVVALENGAKP